jgi:hypothetical protein
VLDVSVNQIKVSRSGIIDKTLIWYHTFGNKKARAFLTLPFRGKRDYLQFGYFVNLSRPNPASPAPKRNMVAGSKTGVRQSATAHAPKSPDN